MARPKGDGRGRLGGRVKGTPNKTTAELREAISPIISRYFNGQGIGKMAVKFEDDLCMMEPDDRARAIIGIAPYVMPKLSSVVVKDTTERKSFKDELAEMASKEDK